MTHLQVCFFVFSLYEHYPSDNYAIKFSDENGRMFAVKSDRNFACFVKKSADHFVDFFIGLNVVPICLARSVLLFLENTLTVETTAIRENRIAPGIISESHFLVEMVGVEPTSKSISEKLSPSAADCF